MSSQLFEEEAPSIAAPKNGRSPRTPRLVEPETALTDPFDEEELPPLPEPVVAEKIIVEPTPEPVTTPEPIPVPAPTPAPVPTALATSGPRTLPDERQSITHAFKLASVEGLLVVGLFDDGTPGELLVVTRRATAPVTAALDVFTETLNLILPYGVPAGALATQLARLSASTEAHEAGQYIATYLQSKFG